MFSVEICLHLRGFWIPESLDDVLYSELMQFLQLDKDRLMLPLTITSGSYTVLCFVSALQSFKAKLSLIGTSVLGLKPNSSV